MAADFQQSGPAANGGPEIPVEKTASAKANSSPAIFTFADIKPGETRFLGQAGFPSGSKTRFLNTPAAIRFSFTRRAQGWGVYPGIPN